LCQKMGSLTAKGKGDLGVELPSQTCIESSIDQRFHVSPDYFGHLLIKSAVILQLGVQSNVELGCFIFVHLTEQLKKLQRTKLSNFEITLHTRATLE